MGILVALWRLFSNADKMEGQLQVTLSDIQRELEAREPHDCAVHGHRFEDVFETAEGTVPPLAVLQEVRFACQVNATGYNTALRTLVSESEKYIHSLCRYCGKTVPRPVEETPEEVSIRVAGEIAISQQDASLMRKRYPALRKGQALFNAFSQRHHALSRNVVGTEIDPFYVDEKIEPFLDWLRGELTNGQEGNPEEKA